MIKEGKDEYSVNLRIQEIIENLNKNFEGDIKTRKDVIKFLSTLNNNSFKNESVTIVSNFEDNTDEENIIVFVNKTIELFILNNSIPTILENLEENDKISEISRKYIINDLYDFTKMYCNPDDKDFITDINKTLEDLDVLKNECIEAYEEEKTITKKDENQMDFDF